MTLTEFPEVSEGSSSRGCEVVGQGPEKLGGERECPLRRKPQLVVVAAEGAPADPETSSSCCLHATPYRREVEVGSGQADGAQRKPQDLELLSSLCGALTLWSVSTRSLELCPTQSQLVGRVWRTLTGET